MALFQVMCYWEVEVLVLLGPTINRIFDKCCVWSDRSYKQAKVDTCMCNDPYQLTGNVAIAQCMVLYYAATQSRQEVKLLRSYLGLGPRPGRSVIDPLPQFYGQQTSDNDSGGIRQRWRWPPKLSLQSTSRLQRLQRAPLHSTLQCRHDCMSKVAQYQYCFGGGGSSYCSIKMVMAPPGDATKGLFSYNFFSQLLQH